MDAPIPIPFRNRYRDNTLSRTINLYQWTSTTIEQCISVLQATTTLTRLGLDIEWPQHSISENRKLRVIESLCHCIATLRRHNPNHPLQRLLIKYGVEVDDVKPYLVAAKQYGIHTLTLMQGVLSIQSLEDFCRGNTHLKVLILGHTLALVDEGSTISASSQDGPQDSWSADLALDKLKIWLLTFKDSTVATKFSNFLAHVTYSTLELEKFSIGDDDDDEDDNEEKKNIRMHILSELIKPSVQQLTLSYCCPIEVMAVIEACTTVTQIRLDRFRPPDHFPLAAVRRTLQTITTRNHELARFVANPGALPGDELLKLMSQCDNCPTGRYMIACCFPAIPSFFKIETTFPTKDTVQGDSTIVPLGATCWLAVLLGSPFIF
jgi:hypothetical protein